MKKSLSHIIFFVALIGYLSFSAPTPVFAERLDGFGLTLRFADSIPGHSIRIKNGAAFESKGKASLISDEIPSWPIVPYFPKSKFGDYFFGGFVMGGGFSTSHYSLHDESVTHGQTANDAGTRYVTDDEKADYCKDDVRIAYGFNTITPNPCTLSVDFSETNVSIGYQLGFLGFGGNETKWLEFAISGNYMLLDYSLDMNVCVSERSDIYSTRTKGDGTCLRESVKIDNAKGRKELITYGMTLNLVRLLNTDSIMSFLEIGILASPEFEIPLKNHEPLFLQYSTNYLNIFTYTLLF